MTFSFPSIDVLAGLASRLFGRCSLTSPAAAKAPAGSTPPTAGAAPPIAAPVKVAWGGRVSAGFKQKIIEIANRLSTDPDILMTIIAFETGGSFDPAEKNRAGSGATGLIQFMPKTAKGLSTTTRALAAMTALDQLDYVEMYLRPYTGRMTDLPSAYMAVLYPKAIDKPLDHVLFRKGSRAYALNRGLDENNNGRVTKAEAAARVQAMLAEGLRPGELG